jgi:hypothetical protein
VARPCHDARVDGAAFDFLLTDAGQRLLAEAEAAYDGSNALAVADRLRADHVAPVVAAALTQVDLRRRAQAKFGAEASTMYFTPDGLEQATHPAVARHRAHRLQAALASSSTTDPSVVDLGCGIGSDLVAFAAAGLRVHAVDRDPVTVAVARANLAARGLAGSVDVEQAESVDRSGYAATFVDPARRGAAGRTFDPAMYSPGWSFVEQVLRDSAVAKVAPGIPHALVPRGVEAEWVSHGGALKEAALWSVGDDLVRSRATVLGDGDGETATLTDRDPAADPHVAAPGRVIYEPDDAVIRAHLVTAVTAIVDGWLLDEHLAYVSSDRVVRTPFGRGYLVEDVLPFKEKQLRAALRARGIGPLTIKKRGVQVSPEALRSRLGLSGSTSATLILTRTPRSSLALLVHPLA